MRIVVAMSGGVDSSVAAAMLKAAGHDVIGVSMQLYDQREGEVSFGTCCTIDDLYDARRVATAIGIPHYILNLEKPFREQVVSNFVQEYLAGRTPLPCARCNSDLKFATLVDRARGFDAELVATGHYARIDHDPVNDLLRLRRGLDPRKDQAYFLFSLTQAQLARALFPLGELTKDVVREYARAHAIPVADKRDSQEICFVADGDYAEFVERHAPPSTPAPGLIVHCNGEVLGRHGGIHRFTVGQRKGLGVASSAPLYVLRLDPRSRTVTVGDRSQLERRTFTASGVNWIAGNAPPSVAAITAQVRYRHRPAPAHLDVAGARVEVTFDDPQPAITPGQAAVFYEGDVMLGGGWIDGDDEKSEV